MPCAGPHYIVLHFLGERWSPPSAAALLLDQDGRNVSGAPVQIDGPLMTLTPERLAPGVYHVSWHSVGHDTHRLDGDFSFHRPADDPAASPSSAGCIEASVMALFGGAMLRTAVGAPARPP